MYEKHPSYYDKEIKTLSRQEGGSHYSKYKIQPVEYAMANNLDYCQANVVKYVTRHKDKNGLEDLKKAIHNIEIEAELCYGVNLREELVKELTSKKANDKVRADPIYFSKSVSVGTYYPSNWFGEAK